ncbi:MAG: hypothetical protein R3265_10140 [Hyphomonas sp.]|nr:hypothetical protein [Hyphomonas sp.]
MSFIAFIVLLVIIAMLVRANKPASVESSQDDERIANLSERVRALEAIILDRDRRLRREIDGLR